MKQSEKQTAKGTKKSVKKRFLTHAHFEEVVEQLTQIYIKQNTLQSVKHEVTSRHQTRISLTGFDTKRYILNDGIHTYAHGHYKSKNI